MIISVKLLTKYVITVYAIGSVHEKSKSPAGLGGKNGRAVTNCNGHS